MRSLRAAREGVMHPANTLIRPVCAIEVGLYTDKLQTRGGSGCCCRMRSTSLKEGARVYWPMACHLSPMSLVFCQPILKPFFSNSTETRASHLVSSCFLSLVANDTQKAKAPFLIAIALCHGVLAVGCSSLRRVVHSYACPVAVLPIVFLAFALLELNPDQLTPWPR